MRARGAIVSAAVLGSYLLACQFIVGVEDENGVSPSFDSGDALVADGGVDASDPCVKQRPPGRPTPGRIPASDGAAELRFLFAMRAYRGVDVDGFDLDDRCTGIAGSTTSEAPCLSPNGSVISDTDGGADNALALGIRNALTGTRDPFGEKASDKAMKGRFTNLVGLDSYNGLENDAEVAVYLSVSAGLTATCILPDEDGGVSGEVEAGTSEGPRWNGCDTWSHVSSDLSDSVWLHPRFGWVVDDLLVVPMVPTWMVGLLVSEVEFSGVTLTARIVRSEKGTVIGLDEGVFAGRAPASAVIRGLTTLDTQGTVVCKADYLWSTLKNAVCGVRDLPLALDRSGPSTQRCEAVSFAFGFNAEVARLGEVRAIAPTDCDGGGPEAPASLEPTCAD